MNENNPDKSAAAVWHDNAPVSPQMRRQGDRDLSQRSVGGVLIYALGWLLVVTGTDLLEHGALLVYAVGSALLLIGLARLWMAHHFESIYRRGADAWRRWFGVGMTLSAGLWSLLSAWGLSRFGMSIEGIILLLPTVLLCGGGVLSLAPEKNFYRLFLAILVIPQLLVLVSLWERDAWLIAAMVVVYVVFLFSIGRNVNRSYWHMLYSNELLDVRAHQLEAAKEQAEAADRAKTYFLTNMGHEVRTPMNIIIGMIHLALQSNVEAGVRGHLQRAHHAADSLLGILNRVLEYARLESGDAELARRRFRVRDVVQGVSESLSQQAIEKGVQFQSSVDEAVPSVLRGDPDSLRQCLMNLAENAVKFTGSGGYASISVSLVQQRDDTIELLFEVGDNGIGMQQDQVRSLFQVFQQGDASSTRSHGGTGLGLILSRRLIEMMGGEIDVDSSPGEGTRVRVLLPFQFVAEEQSAADRSPAARDDEQPENRVAHNTFDREAARPLFDSLMGRLEDNDVEAIETLERLADEVNNSPYAEQLGQVGLAVRRYDFDNAAEALQQLMDRIYS